jgi:hypothetical protein
VPPGTSLKQLATHTLNTGPNWLYIKRHQRLYGTLTFDAGREDTQKINESLPNNRHRLITKDYAFHIFKTTDRHFCISEPVTPTCLTRLEIKPTDAEEIVPDFCFITYKSTGCALSMKTEIH